MNSAAVKIHELKKLSWESLSSLPSMSQREFILGDARWIESVWVDRLPDNELRVVVQVYKPGFLGTGQMQAEGFKRRSSGKFLELSESELYEFL